jgi:hypothetical protein
MENTRIGIKGGTPDISHTLMFYWFEPVLYLDPVSKFRFPETTERPGYFVGFTDNVRGELSLLCIEIWLDQQQMSIIGIKEYHLNPMYKNHLNF